MWFLCADWKFSHCTYEEKGTKQHCTRGTERIGTWINLLGKIIFFIPLLFLICKIWLILCVHRIWLNHSSKSSPCNCKWLQRKLFHCTMIRIVFWWIFTSDATKWIVFHNVRVSSALKTSTDGRAGRALIPMILLNDSSIFPFVFGINESENISFWLQLLTLKRRNVVVEILETVSTLCCGFRCYSKIYFPSATNKLGDSIQIAIPYGCRPYKLSKSCLKTRDYVGLSMSFEFSIF